MGKVVCWGLWVYVWGMGAGRRPLTRELYENLVIAFRETPGNATAAARHARCDRRLARRLWDGKEHQDAPWAERIKARLAREEAEATQEALRAQRAAHDQLEADRARLRQEAAQAQEQERQLLRTARGDVLASLAIAAELVPAMRQVARAITEACKPDPHTGAPPTLDPFKAMRLLGQHALLVQRAVGATEAVVQLSRLDRGATTAHVEVAGTEAMGLDAALDELEALDQVLRAGRARRALPVAADGD